MSAEKMPVVRARDVMRKGVVKVDGMATAAEAGALMRREKMPALIVTKRHEDDAWGLVVVQDLIRGVILAGRLSEDVNVYEIMTKPAITVPADMDIRYVARLLFRAGIRRAPVEDRGELVGMVSLSSLILDNEMF
ncbi:MAG: CBS domain-containing protein [Proteobacteria bacterium]|nr:CBS domain-containing protein [Pseudomonadota bacterium]MBU1641367.1 CBS domain-containing protein [Pseudomonadota bacterium]